MRDLDVSGPQVLVTGVQFQENLVEITYTESREQQDRIAMVRVLVFDAGLADTELGEIQESLRELVDQILIKMRRDPPALGR